jgi:hypothetical protein
VGGLGGEDIVKEHFIQAIEKIYEHIEIGRVNLTKHTGLRRIRGV